MSVTARETAFALLLVFSAPAHASPVCLDETSCDIQKLQERVRDLEVERAKDSATYIRLINKLFDALDRQGQQILELQNDVNRLKPNELLQPYTKP